MLRLRRLPLVLLVTCATTNCNVERRGGQNPANDGAAAAEQVFDRFFGETAAERQALQQVEVDGREERRIGEAGIQDLLNSLRAQRIRVLTRGKDVDYLVSLTAEIRPRMQNAKRYRTIHVYVAETDSLDARAFPGGSIVFTTGMLDFAGSEAAVVGVLAHELSHIDHGHQLRLARGVKLAEQGWSGERSPDFGMPANVMLATKQFARPFHAEDEAEADRDSATWSFELGYEPLEMAKLFRRLDRLHPAGPVRMPDFVRTHPYNAERYAAVKKLADELRASQPKRKPYVGIKNLRQRTPRSVKRFPE